MTGVTYDKAALTIEVDGLEGVARALEDIPQKTPAGGQGGHQQHHPAPRELRSRQPEPAMP